MASSASPSPSDDFEMLDIYQTHDLPLRQRHCDDEADPNPMSPSSDSDIEHISRPGSVRSLNTLSPTPSPSLLPATVGDRTVVSSLVLPPSGPISRRHHDSRALYQAEHEKYTRHVLDRSNVSLPVPVAPAQHSPPSTCHDHATIDQQIMDLLIEHALTTHIDKEHGHGSSKNQHLRLQMMTRFRSLPAQHSFVKAVLSHIDGGKTLIQGQSRTPAEVEEIYRLVFTDVERMALNFLVECHTRHFEKVCHFWHPPMSVGRTQLYRTMLDSDANKGKALALDVQSTVLRRFDTDSAFESLCGNLQKQTRSRIDWITYAHPISTMNREAIRDPSTSPRSRLDVFQKTFYTTVTNLPNDRFNPGDPINYPYTAASSAMKRNLPLDETEQVPNRLNLSLEKLQYDHRRPEILDDERPSTMMKPAEMSFSTQECVLFETQHEAESRQSFTSPPLGFKDEVPPRGRKQASRHCLQEYDTQLKLLKQEYGKPVVCEQDHTTHCFSSSRGKMARERKVEPIRGYQAATRERFVKGSDLDESRLTWAPRMSKRDLIHGSRDPAAMFDHFYVPPQNELSEAQSPLREYRQNTLLARSTQRPTPYSCKVSRERAMVLGLLETTADTFETQASASPYSFAPAHQPHRSGKIPKAWTADMALREGNRGHWRVKIADSAARQTDTTPVMTNDDLTCAVDVQPKRYVTSQHRFAEGLYDRMNDPSVQTMPDYQSQLLFLEEANRKRLRVTPSTRNCPAVTISRRTDWTTVDCVISGHKMEYLFRKDIETIDTDTLPWYFKDLNCLYESCEGWKSAAQQAREAHAEHMNYADREMPDAFEMCGNGLRLDRAPAATAKERLRQNQIAWALAELNETLRVTRPMSKELLRAAVNHFMSLQRNQRSTEDQTRQDASKTAARRPEDTIMFSNCRDAFADETAGDSVDNIHVEQDSSSNSEDEDRDNERIIMTQMGIEQSFPQAFFDAEGVPHQTFEHKVSPTSDSNFYTVRTDFSEGRCKRSEMEPPRDGCICDQTTRSCRSVVARTHSQDCNVSMALSQLNPILRGKENEKLCSVAIMEHALLVHMDAWELMGRKSKGRNKGNGMVYSPMVPGGDVNGAFTLFRRAPTTSEMSAQCNHCNMIVDGTGTVALVSHLVKCDMYAKRR